MTTTGQIGIANDPIERERIEVAEQSLFATMGRHRRPSFWSDADVRRLLIAEHTFLTLDQARARLIELVGEERAPSRSAIHRFWQLLDRFWSKRQ